MSISVIIGTVLLSVVGLIALWALLNIIKFLFMFHGRKCKYCGHTMVFKGFKNSDGKEVYDFHCNHCGAWERLTRDEMFGDGETSVA